MVLSEIGDRAGDSLSVKSGESRAEVFLPHDTIREEGLNHMAVFGAESKLLSPRARGGGDRGMGWMVDTKAARQKLRAEQVEFITNRKDLGFLVEVFPSCRRVATGDDTEGGALDALKAKDRRSTDVRGPNRGGVGEERLDVLFVGHGESFLAATPRCAC